MGNVKFAIIYNTNSVVLESVPIATSTVVTEAPATGLPNTLYTITATVTPEVGATGPTPGVVDLLVSGPTATPIAAVTIANAGGGYAMGNILTVQNGTFTQAAQLTVTAIGAGGTVTGVTVTQNGTYTALPANPASVSGGSGTGATFTVYNYTAPVPVPTGTVPTSVVTFPLQGLNVGTYTVTSATYVSTDAGFIGSTAPANDSPSFTVSQDFSTNVVTASSGNDNPSVYGEPTTFTDIVSPGTAGPLLPTGTVTFLADGNPIDGASGTVAITSQLGVVTGANVATGGSGYSVGNVLTLQGGTPTQAATLTVTAVNLLTGAVTGVQVSNGGSYTSFPVPFNPFSVTGGTGTGATFNLTDGTPVTFTTDDLSVTTHSISAVYNGDTNYHGPTNSTNSLVQTVTKNFTTTTVTSSPASPANYNQVTVTATITGNAPGVLSPIKGNVIFTITGTYFDGTTIPTITEADVLNGSNKVNLSQVLLPGHYVINASYGGDNLDFLGSNSTTTMTGLVLTVNQVGTTSMLTTSNINGPFGTVAITDTVTPTATGPAAPTGTVTFFIGGSVTKQVNVDGDGQQRQAPWPCCPPGPGPGHLQHQRATYNGDNNFIGSASSSTITNQVITKAGTAIAISTPPSAVPFGMPVATATVSSVTTPALINPSGTVNFFVNGNPSPMPVAIVGTLSAPVVASGGSGYSMGDVLTVQGGTFTTPAQFTVSSTSAGGVITGVTLTQAGSYSVVPTMPAGVTGGTGSGATFTFTPVGTANLFLPPGNNYSIFATYPGNTDYNPSGPTNTVVQTVTKAVSQVTITSPNPSNSDAVPFAITVQTFLGQVPTGDITTLTLWSGSTPVGPGTVIATNIPLDGSGVGHDTFTFTADGVYTLQAAYGGDPFYSPGNSASTR